MSCWRCGPRWPPDVRRSCSPTRREGPATGRGPAARAWSRAPRSPAMSSVYPQERRDRARRVGERVGVILGEGVYAWFLGPSYETPAEVQMARRLGADLVGMSTVPEAIAARHMGAKVLGISLVTNLAAGISPTPLSP